MLCDETHKTAFFNFNSNVESGTILKVYRGSISKLLHNIAGFLQLSADMKIHV